MSQTKFRGVPVQLDGRTYVVPSLSVIQFRSYADALAQPTAAETSAELIELFDRYIPIIGTAVRRNYPDVSDDQLGEWLDMDSFPVALRAVQGASGMEKVQQDDQGNE